LAPYLEFETWRTMMRVNQWIVTCVAAGLLGLAPISAQAELVQFTADITPDQEVHEVMSEAFGAAQLEYDTVANLLDLSVQITGIDKNDLTNYHLHIAPAGLSGGVIAGLPGDFVIGVGQITLDLQDVAINELDEPALLAGNTYLNFHTVTYGPGEIRGQVIPIPEPASMSLLLAMGALCMRRRGKGSRGK
jgi:hypothetical protein